MSLQPRHGERGLQLGIGVASPRTYIPFSQPNEDGNEECWTRSTLENRGIMYFRDMRVLQNSRNDSFEDSNDVNKLHQNDNMEEVTYPINNQKFWDSILGNQYPSKVIKDIKLQSNEELITVDNTGIADKFYVPSSLVSKIEKGEMSMTSDDGHRKTNKPIRIESSHNTRDFKAIDPTRKRQFALAEFLPIVDARLDKDATTLLITIEGSTQSNLSIQTLSTDRKTKLYECTFKPRIINLQSRIKHIEVPKPTNYLGKYPNLFAVITDSKLHIIRLDRIDESGIELTEFLPLEFLEFEQFPIVDIAFNPWDMMEMALVDSKGNWILAKLETHKRKPCTIKLKSDISGSIFDPTVTSPWHHIDWIDDHSSLVVLNRSKMVSINYVENWQLDIVEAKTWSELRDYKRINDNTALLLTSQEIILLDIQNNSFRRMISWKHNWDTNDPSIRMSYKLEEGNNYTHLIHVLIFSKLTLKVYGISIGYKENAWTVIACKPFLLSLDNVKSKHGINSIEFSTCSTEFASDKSEGDIVDNDDDEFAKDIVCVLGFIELNTLVQGFLSTKNSPNHLHLSSHINQPTYNDRSLEKICDAFDHSIPVPKADHQVENEYHMFQEFGYELSERLNKLLDSWKSRSDKYNLNIESLAYLDVCPSYFQSITEYVSLIEQLIAYYQNHNLVFSEVRLFIEQLIGENLGSWEDLFNRLVIAWDPVSTEAEHLSRTVIRDIALYLTLYQQQDTIKTSLDVISEELSDSMKSLLNSWDSDPTEEFNDVNATPITTFSQALSSQQFQVPTIKSSQQVNRKKRAAALSSAANGINSGTTRVSHRSASQPTQMMANSYTLPGSIPPAFSLSGSSRASQPLSAASQPEGHQRQRRKKKKVGGFN